MIACISQIISNYIAKNFTTNGHYHNIYPTLVYFCIRLGGGGITVIYSLPDGYKGVYDPYIPPSG